jgi:hypothetical protein
MDLGIGPAIVFFASLFKCAVRVGDVLPPVHFFLRLIFARRRFRLLFSTTPPIHTRL